MAMLSESMRSRLTSTSRATVVLLSILITLSFWAVLPDQWQANDSSDYRGFYEPVASQLLEGNGFRHADGAIATQYPPGFPLLLAAVFGSAELLRVLHPTLLQLAILLSVLICVLAVHGIASLLYSPLRALLAAFVLSTYPLFLWTTKQPNSEVAFLPFFLVAAYLFLRAYFSASKRLWLYFVIGILLGCAMLIRPAGIGLGMLFALFTLTNRTYTWRKRFVLIGILLLGNVLVVTPWIGWVYAETGNWILLSSNGAASMRDGLTFAIESKGYRQPLTISGELTALMRSILDETQAFNSTAELVRYMFAQFSEQPVTVVKLYLWKAVRSWYASDSHRLDNYVNLLQLLYIVLIGMGLYRAINGDVRRRQFALFVSSVTAYFWFMTILVLSIVRYMLPALCLLIVFVPLAFTSERFNLRQRVVTDQ